MAVLVERYGDLWPVRRVSAFTALARILIGQQISVKAAATIFGRVADRCSGRLTAGRILDLSESEMRECGLSRQKRAALQDLAARTGDGRLRPDQLWRMDDDGVRAAVTSVCGLGPWSAEIFLMFGLGRPDLLPVSDLGLRSGFRTFLQTRRDPTPARMEETARPWRPWRTLACLYLWALLDNPPTPGKP
jgi:DNA-3-methyladenine glycosylase II